MNSTVHVFVAQPPAASNVLETSAKIAILLSYWTKAINVSVLQVFTTLQAQLLALTLEDACCALERAAIPVLALTGLYALNVKMASLRPSSVLLVVEPVLVLQANTTSLLLVPVSVPVLTVEQRSAQLAQITYALYAILHIIW